MPTPNVQVFIPAERIATRVAELGAQINADYAGQSVVVVGVLKGSFMFMADLIRHLTIPVRLDFMGTKSYIGTTTSGQVQITKDLDKPIEGEHVLLVEDIIDTGLTLNYLKRNLEQRRPQSLKTIAFLDKPSQRRVDIHADYVGFEIENKFVIGYGLDFEQQYRQLADLCVLAG
jgi:hypoxanthine phosphoribosyltransferase